MEAELSDAPPTLLASLAPLSSAPPSFLEPDDLLVTAGNSPAPETVLDDTEHAGQPITTFDILPPVASPSYLPSLQPPVSSFAFSFSEVEAEAAQEHGGYAGAAGYSSRWLGPQLVIPRRPSLLHRHSEPLTGTTTSSWSPAISPTPSFSGVMPGRVLSFGSSDTEDTGASPATSPALTDQFSQVGFFSPRPPVPAFAAMGTIQPPPATRSEAGDDELTRPIFQSSSSEVESWTLDPRQTTRSSAGPKPRKAAKLASSGRSSSKRERKQVETVQVACKECSSVFMTINLRGSAEDLECEWEVCYVCAACHPSTTTAAGATISKSKRKLEADMKRQVKCDICLRFIGAGAVNPIDDGADLQLAIEFNCSPCLAKYQRCSDCGGGGGARLSVGKWRAKEVFMEDRKTCRLAHQRLGHAAAPEFLAGPVKDIPLDEHEQLRAECGKVFENAMLSMLAIPEVLETGHSPGIFTFEEVGQKLYQEWQRIESNLTTPIPAEFHVERYLGLRRVTPNLRKKQTVAARQAAANAVIAEELAFPDTWLSCNKTLAGFVMAEWQKPQGTLFFQINCPWGSGETQDGQIQLISALGRRVMEDRGLEIEDLQAKGYSLADAIFYCPEIRHFWTMVFYNRESKVVKYLERRRGFMPLDEYLARYPDVSPALFPPLREVPIPVEEHHQWTILVKSTLEGVNDHMCSVVESVGRL